MSDPRTLRPIASGDLRRALCISSKISHTGRRRGCLPDEDDDRLIEFVCFPVIYNMNKFKGLLVERVQGGVLGFWGFGEIGRASCRERV